MKITIATFLLPQEMDAYERMLTSFLRASQHINGSNYELLTIMSLSDYLIDWDKSKMDKEYFVERFNSLKIFTDWTPNVKFEIRDDILGCTDLRRSALTLSPDATHVLWLDSDVAFDELSLAVLESSIEMMKAQGIENYVITPEIIKMWDSSWDCIVNDAYMNDPHDSIGFYNAFKEAGIKGDVSLIPIDTFKFAGGWFTCFSRSALELAPLPDSLGHYGIEDTYVMEALKMYKARHPNSIFQFKMKNLVVSPNHKYHDRKYYDYLITKRDRRNESKDSANKNFIIELNNFYKKLYENN